VLIEIPDATTTAPLTMERVGDLGAFCALRQEWEELLRSSDSDCIFLTWEWLYTWWKHLAEDRSLAILAVRRGGELIALQPVCLRPRSILQGRPLPMLEFLGSGFAGSDYLDVIVRKGCAADALSALSSHLTDRRLPLKWTNVRRGDTAASAVTAALTAMGWSSSETTTNTCPYIPLAGMTWDSFLASRSAEHRYNFNRKWRRLNRDYDVCFEQARTESQVREVIEVLIAQHNKRWSARGGSDAFHTADLRAFHREWTQSALQRGWLRLFVLRLNLLPAACLYGLMYQGTFYFYQSSFDSAYAQSSVGLITMGLAIRNAIEEGAEEYDLLHGDEAYKSHWSRQSRNLVRLESFPPGGLNTAYRLSLKLGRATRALARRVARGQDV
jgi:CelD/BcsL family acetyltransferase involved in cellulose biosynthesis